MPRNISPGPTASERTRASRIRAALKMGQEIDSEDAAWFADYETAREATAQAKASRGASQSRKVSYTEEESAAVGEGDPIVAAAAAGAVEREAGQRLDGIMALSMASMKEANELLLTMTKQMMKRTENFEITLVKMMEAQANLIHSHRENALRATDAEIRAMELEKGAEEDGLSKMAAELLPILMERLGNK